MIFLGAQVRSGIVLQDLGQLVGVSEATGPALFAALHPDLVFLKHQEVDGKVLYRSY